MTRPLTIGLTGSVAAGKSAALGAFGRLGAETISSDAIVHELLGTAEVRDAIAGHWGPDALTEGEIDRAKVGRIAFADPAELRWLEGQLHPRVRQRMVDWMSGLPADTEFAVVEVPLLFEGGLGGTFDTTVAVTVSEEVRRERAEARGTSLVSERDSQQLTQDEKAAQAAHVVPNEGTVEDLEAAISELLDELRSVDRGGPPESLAS